MGHADGESSDNPDGPPEDLDAETPQHIAAAYDNRNDILAALEIAIVPHEERHTGRQREISKVACGVGNPEIQDNDLLVCLWHAAREQNTNVLAHVVHQRLERVCTANPYDEEPETVEVDPERFYLCTRDQYASVALVHAETGDYAGPLHEVAEKIDTLDGSTKTRTGTVRADWLSFSRSPEQRRSLNPVASQAPHSRAKRVWRGLDPRAAFAA